MECKVIDRDMGLQLSLQRTAMVCIKRDELVVSEGPFDADGEMLRTTFELMGCVEGDEEGELVRIGSISGLVFQLCDVDARFVDDCDNVSGDLYTLATALSKHKKFLSADDAIWKYLFYVESIEIDAQYRGQGLGTDFLNLLPNAFERLLNSELAGVFLHPTQGNGKEYFTRLVDFYKSCGFTAFKSSKSLYYKSMV